MQPNAGIPSRDTRLLGEAAAGARADGRSRPKLEAGASAFITAMVDTLKPEYGTALRRVGLDGLSVRRCVQIARERAGHPTHAAPDVQHALVRFQIGQTGKGLHPLVSKR